MLWSPVGIRALRLAPFKARFTGRVKVRVAFWGGWTLETSEGGGLSLFASASLGKVLGDTSEEIFQDVGLGQTL